MLMKNLATSFIIHETITTTVAKAKLLRSYAERLITLAGADNLAARRRAITKLTDKKAVDKLFAILGPKFKSRQGGYTRIRRSTRRVGDASEQAVISLVE